MLVLIYIQFIFPSAVLLILLSSKTNLLDALGLHNCNWGKISFGLRASMILIYASLALLMALGMEEWLTKHFGELDTQAAVEALQQASSPVKLSVMILTAVVVAPICEELLFRSFLYTILKKHTGFIFAVVSSALLFSVIHGSVKAAIPLFVIGIILAVAYELSGSVWTNILIHAAFNLINVLMMLNM